MFQERLRIDVTLTIAGTAYTIPGGNVRHLELDLWSWGFAGLVEIWMTDDKAHGGGYEDKLKTALLGPDLVEAKVAASAVYPDPETSASIEPITVSGLVTTKSIAEAEFWQNQETAILYRRYRLRFADAAQVLWRQHFPCELYTQKSMKDVIEAHKGDKITLTYDWTPLTTAQPMLFLGLDAGSGASFYDWLLWYVASQDGVYSYDYTAAGYKLAATKDATGKPLQLPRDDVAGLTVELPEVVRHNVRVLNAYATTPATKAISQDQAATGIRQDHLLRTPIAQSVDDRVTLETARLFVRGLEAELGFARWPTLTLAPGTRLELPESLLWSSEGSLAGQTLRIFHIHVDAQALVQGIDQDYGGPSTGFRGTLTAIAELDAEKTLRLPRYRSPAYPVGVEGKIVSEQGEEKDETYQIYTDADTSQDQYKVAIPLWDNQQVTALLGPQQRSDRVYLPLHKNDRVLLAFDLASAAIVEVLDWREGARLPMEGQGDQVLFGKTQTSKTSVSFAYAKDKPVFTIARVNDKDTATVELNEGVLRLVVKENA